MRRDPGAPSLGQHVLEVGTEGTVMEGLAPPVNKHIGEDFRLVARQPEPSQALLGMQMHHFPQILGQRIGDGPAPPFAHILVVPESHNHAAIGLQMDFIARALLGPPAVWIHAWACVEWRAQGPDTAGPLGGQPAKHEASQQSIMQAACQGKRHGAVLQVMQDRLPCTCRDAGQLCCCAPVVLLSKGCDIQSVSSHALPDLLVQPHHPCLQ